MAKWTNLIVVLLSATLIACPKDQDQDSATESGGGSTSTTTDATSGAPTTGEGGASRCQKICEHLVECGSMFAPTVAVCVALCADKSGTPDCVSATAEWFECIGDAPCGDEQSLPGGMCAVCYADFAVSCAGCPAIAEQGDAPGSCSAMADCPHLVTVDFVCEGDTCVCELEDEQFASCPAMDVCAGDDAAIFAAASACCEMPFVGHDL